MFTALALLAAVAFVGAMVYRAVRKYRTTTGTKWVRIKATFEDSEALLVAYLTTIGGTVTSIAGAFADNLDQQWFTEWMNAHLSVKGVGIGVAVLGAVFFLAKLRGIAAYFRPQV